MAGAIRKSNVTDPAETNASHLRALPQTPSLIAKAGAAGHDLRHTRLQ